MLHDYRKELEQLLAQLKTERDELSVKSHLAKAEAREQWDAAEQQWQNFKQKSEKILTEVDRSSSEVKQALNTLADELKSGYRRIREQLR